MDRFIIKKDFGLIINCDICSRKNKCDYDDSNESCVYELKERLFKLEESISIAEEKIRSNLILSSLYDRMKGD